MEDHVSIASAHGKPRPCFRLYMHLHLLMASSHHAYKASMSSHCKVYSCTAQVWCSGGEMDQTQSKILEYSTFKERDTHSQGGHSCCRADFQLRESTCRGGSACADTQRPLYTLRVCDGPACSSMGVLRQISIVCLSLMRGGGIIYLNPAMRMFDYTAASNAQMLGNW